MDSAVTPGDQLPGCLTKHVFTELTHKAESLDLGQKFQWPHQTMLRVVPAHQRFGFAGQPLAAGVSFNLGLIAKHKLPVFEGVLHFLPGDAKHAAAATPCRGTQVIKVKVLADPLDVVEARQLVDEFGLLATAQ